MWISVSKMVATRMFEDEWAPGSYGWIAGAGLHLMVMLSTSSLYSGLAPLVNLVKEADLSSKHD